MVIILALSTLIVWCSLMYLLTLWYLSESQCTFAKSMRWYAAIGFRGTKNSERRSGQTSSRSYSKLYATISARPLGKDTVTIPNGKGKRQKAKGKGQKTENKKQIKGETENWRQKKDETENWKRTQKKEHRKTKTEKNEKNGIPILEMIYMSTLECCLQQLTACCFTFVN